MIEKGSFFLWNNVKKWLSAPSNGAKAIFVLSILLGLIPWQIASQYIDQALVSRERELIAAQMTPLGQQVSNYFSDGVSILNGIQGFATLKEKNQTLATELNFQDFIQSMVVDERQIIQAALINDTQQYLFKDVLKGL